jgi:NAD(P)-dependent dehydrogenase (short-subunit alcohol dehydrogenase family)
MDNPFSLAGKTALVTGAGSGIGRACALRLASLGAKVVLSGRNREALAAVLAACQGGGHRVEIAELADAGALAALAANCPELDAVVHSAGICELKPARFSDATFLRRLLAVNLEAPLALTQQLLAGGKLRTGTSVVFVGSVSGEVGESAMSAYAASKGGLHSAARSLAIELAPKKIRVNTVAPGSVCTPLLDGLLADMSDESKAALERAHPLGLGEPDDVACAVAYLASPAARRVTGTTLFVDGGYTAR